MLQIYAPQTHPFAFLAGLPTHCLVCRTIVSEHFGSLSLPVGEFLALEHGTEYAGYAIMKEETEAIEVRTPGWGRPATH